ncbi:MAG: septation protein IspZ [Gammaproteobacteria bacterium]|nr:septation protein IspZ [Gammaproteobacteria bacterium]
MKFLYDILPVFLFFIAFKFYDIYVATVVGIIATLLQVFITRLWHGKWDNKELITCGVFIIFGGMTLYFHNPIFVKWKPTIVFGIFSIVIFATQFITAKPLMQRLMENALGEKGIVPPKVWLRINLIWSAFFLGMAALNLYIAYYMSNEAWVNFKFYGISLALIGISVVQAVYLIRFTSETDKNNG